MKHFHLQFLRSGSLSLGTSEVGSLQEFAGIDAALKSAHTQCPTTFSMTVHAADERVVARLRFDGMWREARAEV